MQRLRWIVKPLAFLAVIGVLALFLTAGGNLKGKEALFGVLSRSALSEWGTREEAVEITGDALGLEKMTPIAQEGGTTLYYHELTGELAVETADGLVWYSNPQDRLERSASRRGEYSSLLVVNVITANETEQTLTSFSDCVQYGQYETQAVENGLRVLYRFGRVAPQELFPAAMTIERFEEILSRLDAEQQTYLKMYYSETNFEKITDQQSRAVLKSSYTNIEQLGVIRVLKNNPSKIEKNRLKDYFTAIGYTAEERERDQEEVGYLPAESKSSHFEIPVEYTLRDGRLYVRIDTAAITAVEDLKITGISVLPYWNTRDSLESTEAVLPDGCGGIVRLGEIVSANTPVYSEAVYGADYSVYQAASVSRKEPLSLPVYGLVSGEGACYAHVESAAENVSITVTPRYTTEETGNVAFRFKLLDYASVKLLESDNDPVRSYPDHANLEEIEVSYTFLEKEKNTWEDIAADYRARLFGDESSGLRSVPAFVQLLGAIDDVEPLLGVPVEVIRELTTFSQAKELLASLRQGVPDAQLVAQYTGWQKGGVRSGLADRVRAESRLGGLDGLLDLSRYCGENGVLLYPDADFQYVYRDGLADGFSLSEDAARLISGETAVKASYSRASFLKDGGRTGYVLRPEKQLAAAARFTESLTGSGLNLLSLPFMGAELSADFTNDRFTSRSEAGRIGVQTLQTLRDAGLELLIGGANEYVLPYAAYLSGVPLQTNDHALITETIPFVQTVLSGYVAYSAPAVNVQNDPELYRLRCIETGSAPYVTLMQADNEILKGTDYDEYYGTALQEDRLELFRGVTEALAPVYGCRIVQYDRPAERVVEVRYDNGVAVAVNYNEESVELDGGLTVPARGCAYREWR
mgnify:CR=1 FL=1